MRALERGLAVLAAMNRHKVASVVELARETQLPRPTVYRLLETLERSGFVARSGAADRFCLAGKVRTLSDGFVDDEWITGIAAPLMAAFTAAHVWPVALMTFEEGRMLIRETTHPASSLSIWMCLAGTEIGLSVLPGRPGTKFKSSANAGAASVQSAKVATISLVIFISLACGRDSDPVNAMRPRRK